VEEAVVEVGMRKFFAGVSSVGINKMGEEGGDWKMKKVNGMK